MYVAEIHSGADETILFLHGGNVAGWMWHAEAEALPNHSLIPDLPGFGASADQPWTDLATSADELADLIQTRAKDGRADVVGLSLGGVLGLVLAARHPKAVRSVFVTGAAVHGVNPFIRWSGLAQVAFWGSRGYWAGLARAFRLPADSIDPFVTTGVGIDRDSARRMMREIYAGLPSTALDGLRTLDAPLLAIAGEREPKAVRHALPEVVSRAPHATAALAPKMHHVWSAEDPELFHDVLSHWLTTAEPSPLLLPAAPLDSAESPTRR